jgi:5-methyltetrahydrofolate--homocysteine methyltransferase
MAADVLMGHDAQCARWIGAHREPVAEGETGGRRVNRRRALLAGAGVGTP